MIALKKAALITSEGPAPRLHPKLADIYRQKVGDLIDILNGSDGEGLRNQLRGLIDTIILYPHGSGHGIEVRGEHATPLTLAADGLVSDVFVLVERFQMVAGKRSSLYRTTFRWP